MPNQEFEAFDEMAETAGLARHAEIMRRYLMPCVGFDLLDGWLEGSSLSKLGGVADLAPGTPYPTYKDQPLDLLLQIDLSELPRHGLSASLPKAGLLSFFYAIEDGPWGFDPADFGAFRVIHSPDIEEVRSTEVRGPAALEERAMRFWQAWSLPSYGSRAGDRLASEMGEFPEDYFAFRRTLLKANAPPSAYAAHQIGGHSNNVQGDMQLEAQLVSNGLYCGNSSGYRDPRAAELEKTCEDWQLLLQLDSDEDDRFMWGDCGMLYFWMRQQDIHDSQFESAWMALQCS